MLFTSFTFWLFCGVVILAYRPLPHRLQNALLLVASYVFYGFWDWRFLSLIALSTLVDYFVSRAIASTPDARTKRRLLLTSLVANLGVLATFKYFGFFARELNDLLAVAGLQAPFPVLELVLPVGISFYTLQTLGYTIDVYRGTSKPAERLDDFALYVAFFPKLVAGPIERSSRLLSQVLEPRKAQPGDFEQGLYLVLTGLFKKVVVADNMAQIVDSVFATDTSKLTGPECLVGIYAFALQIYGDFSGYSAIARGVAKWLGFDLMVNFRMPYFATDPSDFWRRWHISLSTWLRDYVYIPLGGNRQGSAKTRRNLILTMVLGGIWHGAGWTFVVWGVFHGLLLVVYRTVAPRDRDRPTSGRLGTVLRAGLMFHLACIGWLVFRATSLSQAGGMLKKMMTDFELTPFAIASFGLLALYTTPLLVHDLFHERKGDLQGLIKTDWRVRGVTYAVCMLSLIVLAPSTGHEFIYFQF